MTQRSSATLLLAIVVVLSLIFTALTIVDAATPSAGARSLLF